MKEAVFSEMIKPVSIAGGSLKLKDELKCSFDILALKQACGS